jgi:uncharacterized protein (DUF2062 family)
MDEPEKERRAWLARLRALVLRELRGGTTPGGVGWAVGVGVFVGTTPLYGLHAPICLALATVLRLNRVVTVLGSTYSIPPLFPLLVLGSLQLGNWALHGELLPISLDTLDGLDPYRFGATWALGSVILGAALGAMAGGAAMLATRVFRLIGSGAP